jgi:hypothetical protein
MRLDSRLAVKECLSRLLTAAQRGVVATPPRHARVFAAGEIVDRWFAQAIGKGAGL